MCVAVALEQVEHDHDAKLARFVLERAHQRSVKRLRQRLTSPPTAGRCG